MSIQWVIFCLSCCAFTVSWGVNLEKMLKRLQALVNERERALQRQRATEELCALVQQPYIAGQLALHEKRLEKFKKFLIQGAHVNAYDDLQCTPLYWAVFHEYYDLVKLLLEHGADVHIGNIHQTTPLHLAVARHNQAIINILIEHGANLYSLDKWGDRSIDLANSTSNTGRYLRKLNIFKAREPILRLLRYYLPNYLAQRIVAYYIYPDF